MHLQRLDAAELRSRTVSIEQILWTVE